MKNLLCVLFGLLPLFVFSQPPEFVLTKGGFLNKEDPSKTYIVYDIADTPQGVLYGRVLKFLTKSYKSAKYVINKIDNEVISINAEQRNEVPCKTLKFDLYYNLSISFKDNKIKIDAPEFSCSTFFSSEPYKLTMSGSNGGFGSEVTIGLFKKDGRPGQKKTIKYLEAFFNLLDTQIMQAASADATTEDW